MPMRKENKKANGVNKGGRPRKEIDQGTFEALCRIQCTEEEIAAVLRVSVDTVDRWCRRLFGAGFAETFKKYSSEGKSSLRRAQFKMAQTNAAMAIWLGKQWLNQRDRMEIDVKQLDADIERELAILDAGSQAAIAGTPESETVN